MKLFTSAFFLMMMLSDSINVFASQDVAVTGNWNNSSTWHINGFPGIPSCGDTVIIPPGVVVTVTSQNDYSSCSSAIFISVQGTLQFTNGNKMDLPCGSSVIVLAGGIIQKSTAGGGNSTHINMCGCTSWNAGAGIINGPQVLGCIVLPVSLLSFTAEQIKDKIDLRWVTATESNNDFFTLERSANGIEFTSVATLPGAGNSSVSQEYYFEDLEPLNNLSYYRLKQTDYDGKFSYSDVIVAKYKNNNLFRIISCTVDESKTLDLIYCGLNKSETSLAIYDFSGDVIYKTQLNSIGGINHAKINTPLGNTGCYLLSLSNGTEIVSEKIFLNFK